LRDSLPLLLDGEIGNRAGADPRPIAWKERQVQGLARSEKENSHSQAEYTGEEYPPALLQVKIRDWQFHQRMTKLAEATTWSLISRRTS
jgi:hypothetical protein